MRRGRDPIPKRLWAAAAAVAREHGINPTSKALHLEFKGLKEFVQSARATKRIGQIFESCNSSLSEQSALSTARADSLVKHVQRQDLLWAAQHLLFIAIIRLSQESRSRLHLEYLNRCGLACVRSRRNV